MSRDTNNRDNGLTLIGFERGGVRRRPTDQELAQYERETRDRTDGCNLDPAKLAQAGADREWLNELTG